MVGSSYTHLHVLGHVASALCPSFSSWEMGLITLLRDTICLAKPKCFRDLTVSHYAPVCSPTPSTMGLGCDWDPQTLPSHTQAADSFLGGACSDSLLSAP